MQEEDFTIDGFEFRTRDEYNEAKKEAETVLYLKSHTNLNDLEVVKKLYLKLIDRQFFHTLIGIYFLKELRQKLIDSNLYQTNEIININLSKLTETNKNHEDKISTDSLKRNHISEKDTLTKNENLLNQEEDSKDNLTDTDNNSILQYKKKMTKYKIISGFLITIILFMIIISYTNQGYLLDYKKFVLNQYASWQEELDAKEQSILEREESLNKREYLRSEEEQIIQKQSLKDNEKVIEKKEKQKSFLDKRTEKNN